MCFFIHIPILTNVKQLVKLCNETVDNLYLKLYLMFSLDVRGLVIYGLTIVGRAIALCLPQLLSISDGRSSAKKNAPHHWRTLLDSIKLI